MSNRTFIAHSPLGDQLEFRSLVGSEQISNLFEYRVRLISTSDSISAKSLLGLDMTVEVDLTTKKNGGGKRYMSGQVVQFTYIGRDGDYSSYMAVLRPKLWHATRRTDFKIFQNERAPDIIKSVLAKYDIGIDDKLTGSYRTWNYMVQYDETDFQFVSRVMENEGIYYYFRHDNGSHTLVLADDIGSHSPLPNGPTTIPYYSGNRAAQVRDEDHIDGWSFGEDIASGYFAADDYDFEKPKALLDTRQRQPAGHAEDSREIYKWPGGYTEVGDGENYARISIEQQKAPREVAHGEGNARNIAPGYLFTFSRHPRGDQNKEYLVEAAHYQFEENVRRSDGAGGSGKGKRAGTDSPTTYRISFDVVPKSTHYRSQRVTPKPHTTGPQTAVVVGPPGEEIYTDKYGRVKVQFHWDRYGTNDQNSSCWIRVSSPWAGSNYGGIFIPRIGQEVIVDFINGDPDYPIITGRVYNADQMPPWQLPDNKTQSGVKTRSSKGGTPGSGEKATPGMTNVIRFEDMAGQEQLWFHAQKDQLTEVENDEDKWVGNDRRKTVDGNETNVIHKNRTETVDIDETITVHGNRTETVDKDEQVTIHQNQQHTVDINRTRKVGNNETVTIGVNRTKSVGSNESDTIGTNWKISTGVLKMESVGLGYMQSTGIFKMVNMGVAYNVNVGALMMTNVGFYQSTTVGMNRSVNVGVDQTTTIGATNTVNVGSAHNVTVGGAINVVAPVINLAASSLIQLSVGGSVIRITEGSIQILSPVDKLNC